MSPNGLDKTCAPCRPKKVPVFKMNDVVEQVHSGEVFKVKIIIQTEHDTLYGVRMPYTERSIYESFTPGHNLKKYTGKK